MAKSKKTNGSAKTRPIERADEGLIEKAPEPVFAPVTRQASAPASEPKLVLLEGREPRQKNYQLDHDYFCAALGECRCGSQKVGTVKKSKIDGSESPVFKQRRVSSVLTIRYKRRVQVEEAALKVPAIAAAIDSGKIRIRR